MVGCVATAGACPQECSGSAVTSHKAPLEMGRHGSTTIAIYRRSRTSVGLKAWSPLRASLFQKGVRWLLTSNGLRASTLLTGSAYGCRLRRRDWLPLQRRRLNTRGQAPPRATNSYLPCPQFAKYGFVLVRDYDQREGWGFTRGRGCPAPHH